jgi:hypothetical protein
MIVWICCSNSLSWLLFGLDWNQERMVCIGLCMVYIIVGGIY